MAFLLRAPLLGLRLGPASALPTIRIAAADTITVVLHIGLPQDVELLDGRWSWNWRNESERTALSALEAALWNLNVTAHS